MGTKVVYNACFGGFGLSAAALELGRTLSGNTAWGETGTEFVRHDPILVQVVEQLGPNASDRYSRLKIMEVFAAAYRIDEYDGNETVEEFGDLTGWVFIK